MPDVPIYVDQPTGVEHHKVLQRGIERAFASRPRSLLFQTVWLHCETRWVPNDTPVKVEVFSAKREPATKIAEFLAGTIQNNMLICKLNNKEQGLITKEHLGGEATPIEFRFLVGRGAEDGEPLKGERKPTLRPAQFRLVRPCQRPVEYLPFVHSY